MMEEAAAINDGIKITSATADQHEWNPKNFHLSEPGFLELNGTLTNRLELEFRYF